MLVISRPEQALRTPQGKQRCHASDDPKLGVPRSARASTARLRGNQAIALFKLLPPPPARSNLGVQTRAGTPYAASKAAMNQVTRNWGCEWALDGIRVNAVAPWYTYTPLTKPVQADLSR